MLDKVISHAQAKAAHTARTAAIGVGAVLFLLAGMAFATLAAWLLLITLTNSLNAALILSGSYFAIGFFLLAMARLGGSGGHAKSTREPTCAAKPPEAQPQDLVVAFMTGVTAGRRARS